MTQPAKQPSDRSQATQHETSRPDLAGQEGAVFLEEPELSVLQRAVVDPRSATPAAISALARRYGNRAVQRLLAQRQPEEDELQTKPLAERHSAAEGFELDGATAGRIDRARGGGQPLDAALQAQMGEAMDHDFSAVRVHTDAEADDLNEQLSAKAFTTGQDVFFREGAYDPGSGGGRELIAHELSHVVQQGSGRVSGDGSGATVRHAGDTFEQEADRAADAAATAAASPVQRQPEGKEELVQGNPAAQRQTPEEEEEPVQAKSSVQQQPEEELIQGQPLVQRQEEEEEIQTQRARDESAYRHSEEGALYTGREVPPAGHLIPPTSTIQRNDVSWEVHSWKLEPGKQLPIMTNNQYADWIEGNRKDEPTTMDCWQALLFYLYKAGTLTQFQLKAIHIRTKVLALTEIPIKQVNPDKPRMFAVQYDIHYAKALRRVISDAKWKKVTLEGWDEDIPAGNVIRINQGEKVLHWLLSEGTQSVDKGVVHRVKDLGSGTGAPILQDRTLQEALDQFGYAPKGDRKAQLNSVQVYHAQPFWT